MSRVSEALQRASEERGRLAPQFLDERRQFGDKPEANQDAGAASKAEVQSSPASWPSSFANPKSWRERLEGLLFGWDLRRFKTHPIVSLEKNSASIEQYGILRERLHERLKELRGQKKACCLSITSPIEGDGKTMVAVNLAAAVALDGEEQVLLVDGDLRSPEVHHYFGIGPGAGLSDYLSSGTPGDVLNYVQDTFLPALKVLPAGKPSGRSSELLARERMRSTMEEIRSTFPSHLVIIDSCPVLSTPDPLILSRYVDGIIMVIRAQKTPRDCLIKAVRSLIPEKLMGIVLNGVELGIASRYYYYPNNKSNS